MFTLTGLKTTKPLENQEVLFLFCDPAGINYLPTTLPYITKKQTKKECFMKKKLNKVNKSKIYLTKFVSKFVSYGLHFFLFKFS